MGFLSFVGDAFNDIFGGNSSRKDAQRYNVQNMAIQQEYAERNMALQNEYNIEAFNRENEYNSPVAQKLRNYQAGINPNWQDGSGVVAQQDSGVSASSPSGGLPTGSNVGGIGDILNLVKLGKDMKKIDSDIDLQRSETAKNYATAHDLQTSSEGKDISNFVQGRYGLDKAASDIFLQGEQGYLLSQQASYTGRLTEYLNASWDESLKLLAAQRNLTEEEKKNLEELRPYLQKSLTAKASADFALPGYYSGQIAVGHEANAVKAAEVEVQKFNAQVNAERAYYQNQLDSALAGQASQLASHDKTLQALDDIKLDAEEYAQKKDWTRRERRVKHQELMRLDERARAEIDEINSRRDLNFMDKVKKRHDIIQGYLNSVSNLMQSGAKVMNAANPLKPFAQ